MSFPSPTVLFPSPQTFPQAPAPIITVRIGAGVIRIVSPLGSIRTEFDVLSGMGELLGIGFGIDATGYPYYDSSSVAASERAQLEIDALGEPVLLD